MNDTSKIWKWMVIGLTILNVTLITSIWCNKPKHPMGERPPHHAPGRGPAEFLIKELKFTPEQTKQFEALVDEHRVAIKTLMETGHDLRNSFFELLKNDIVNEEIVSTKSLAISENQKKIELATFLHFQKVRLICTPDQKKHFDEIIDSVLKQMGGPQDKPGHGPPSPADH